MNPEFFWCIPAGFAAGLLCVPLFNAVPARWLCDYGEEPGPELLGRRVSIGREGVLLGIVFGAVFLLFAFQYGVSPVFFLLCAAAVPIALAAVSDVKYRIIPDECLPAVLLPALADMVSRSVGKNGILRLLGIPVSRGACRRRCVAARRSAGTHFLPQGERRVRRCEAFRRGGLSLRLSRKQSTLFC